MKFLTKKNVKAATFDFIPRLLGIRIPGFIRIHFRYAMRNPLIWIVLVIAPFIFGLILLSAFSTHVLDVQAKGWQLFLVTIFLIALAFFLAERSRKFRTIYVTAIPSMVIANGLFNLFVKDGYSFGGLVAFGLLSALPAWVLAKLSLGPGYRLLSDGGFKNYRVGRNLYMDGKTAEGLALLEPIARKGHMKSLYLLGHAHEHGNGVECDLMKAAKFYEKAGSKGYAKASRAFENLLQSFDPEQMALYEADMSTLEVNQLL